MPCAAGSASGFYRTNRHSSFPARLFIRKTESTQPAIPAECKCNSLIVEPIDSVRCS